MSAKERCSKRIFTGQRWEVRGHQCSRYSVTTVDGKPYCKIHTPANIEARRQALHTKWDNENKKRDAHWKAAAAKQKLADACVASYGKLPDPLAAAEGDLLGACMALVDYIVRNADNSGAETATTERARALLAKTKGVE